jgi:hypothetical protein
MLSHDISAIPMEPKWNCHVKNIVTKANKRMFSLRECRRANLPPEVVGIACYESKIRPVLEYAAPIWGGLPQYLIDEITVMK